ncbi:MAG: hypothetical protein ACI4W0_04185 [Bacilli bacterium]
MKNIIVENKKREYIADIIKSICEKYRFNKVNNDELSKVTGKVYSLDSKLIIKSDSDILIKDAEVISLVYQICNLLNIDAIIKINIGSIKYDKLKEYLDLLEINFEIDDKIKTDEYAYEVYSNDVKLGEGCKSHASIDLEKVIKEIEDNGTNIPVEENIDVLFTATSENELETASYLMQNLRLNGFITEIGDKLSAKFNIILKDKDLEHNEVIIKDNVTGEETKSNINDIVEYLEMNI